MPSSLIVHRLPVSFRDVFPSQNDAQVIVNVQTGNFAHAKLVGRCDEPFILKITGLIK